MDTTTTELEGIAWVELAEDHARDTADEKLCLALVYMRGSLARSASVALNLAEALQRITDDSSSALEHILSGDGSTSSLASFATLDDTTRRVRLLSSGWRWLARLTTEARRSVDAENRVDASP